MGDRLPVVEATVADAAELDEIRRQLEEGKAKLAKIADENRRLDELEKELDKQANKTNVNDKIAEQEQQALDNAESVRQDLERRKAKVAARVKAVKAHRRKKGFVSPLRF